MEATNSVYLAKGCNWQEERKIEQKKRKKKLGKNAYNSFNSNSSSISGAYLDETTDIFHFYYSFIYFHLISWYLP